MTNYVPIPGMQIPQLNQMTSHPTIPLQQPIVQNNPLVNPLRDISGRNRTIEDVFRDRVQLQEEAKKRQEEEIESRLKAYEDKKKEESGKSYSELPIIHEGHQPTPKKYMYEPDEEKEEERRMNILRGLHGQSKELSERVKNMSENKDTDIPVAIPVKNPQGRKPTISDDDKRTYLSPENYRELVQLETDYYAGMFDTSSMDYQRIKA